MDVLIALKDGVLTLRDKIEITLPESEINCRPFFLVMAFFFKATFLLFTSCSESEDDKATGFGRFLAICVFSKGPLLCFAPK